MKFSVRRGLFETNSSSSHSLTVKNNWKPDPNVDYTSKFRIKDNCVLVDMSYATPTECTNWGEYAQKEFKTPEQKLALAIRMCSGNGQDTLNEMKNCGEYCEFHEIMEVLKKYVKCDDIIIDGLEYRSESKYPEDSSDAYIYPYRFDDDICTLIDYLRKMGITLEQMLLDDSIICVSSYECY